MASEKHSGRPGVLCISFAGFAPRKQAFVESSSCDLTNQALSMQEREVEDRLLETCNNPVKSLGDGC